MSRFPGWFAAGAAALAFGCATAPTTGTGSGTRNVAEKPATGPVTHAYGSVLGFTTGPSGEVEGFLLDDNTRIHIPAGSMAKLNSVVTQGARVDVEGRSGTGTDGLAIIDADKITNADNGTSVALSDAASGDRPAANAPSTVSPSGTNPNAPGTPAAGGSGADAAPGDAATPPVGTPH